MSLGIWTIHLAFLTLLALSASLADVLCPFGLTFTPSLRHFDAVVRPKAPGSHRKTEVLVASLSYPLLLCIIYRCFGG